jgi:DNA-binding transcriptional ArsR family regulator
MLALLFRGLAKYQMANPVFKALSDPNRRRVLELLRAGPMTAGELASEFSVSKSTMSAHFLILRNAELIVQERIGQQVYYSLRLSVLEEALTRFASLFGIGLPRDASLNPVMKTEARS